MAAYLMLLPCRVIEEAIARVLRPSSKLGLHHQGTVVSPVKIVQEILRQKDKSSKERAKKAQELAGMHESVSAMALSLPGFGSHAPPPACAGTNKSKSKSTSTSASANTSANTDTQASAQTNTSAKTSSGSGSDSSDRDSDSDSGSGSFSGSGSASDSDSDVDGCGDSGDEDSPEVAGYGLHGHSAEDVEAYFAPHLPAVTAVRSRTGKAPAPAPARTRPAVPPSGLKLLQTGGYIHGMCLHMRRQSIFKFLGVMKEVVLDEAEEGEARESPFQRATKVRVYMHYRSINKAHALTCECACLLYFLLAALAYSWIHALTSDYTHLILRK